MIHQIDRCRICGNTDLRLVIDLGSQALTGIFPRTREQPITSGPLELVRCHAGSSDGKHCGLVQLRHSYDMGEMYGENYGYRSSLNRSMVQHLQGKVASLLKIAPVGQNDLVLDIGSNDGTTLSFYPQSGPTLVGMDPTAAKFRSYYRPDIHVIADFFSADNLRKHFGDRKARIVTSIAMFYDLEDPQAFVRQVSSILDPKAGIWHFEQSYLPSMLKTTSYDTICHEHVEYYSLRQIKWLTDRADLKIIDVELNDINGGSSAITVARTSSTHQPSARVAELLAKEDELKLLDAAPYDQFASRVIEHRDRLIALLGKLQAEGKRIVGYGASTKGNVILQYCGLSEREIPQVAEVNADKFGCFTPGTRIPIVSEADAKAAKPDYLLVLPWHFRDNLVKREDAYLRAGGKMIFPLPEIEIVTAPNR
jgi:hypothetical protein